MPSYRKSMVKMNSPMDFDDSPHKTLRSKRNTPEQNYSKILSGNAKKRLKTSPDPFYQSLYGSTIKSPKFIIQHGECSALKPPAEDEKPRPKRRRMPVISEEVRLETEEILKRLKVNSSINNKPITPKVKVHDYSIRSTIMVTPSNEKPVPRRRRTMMISEEARREAEKVIKKLKPLSPKTLKEMNAPRVKQSSSKKTENKAPSYKTHSRTSIDSQKIKLKPYQIPTRKNGSVAKQKSLLVITNMDQSPKMQKNIKRNIPANTPKSGMSSEEMEFLMNEKLCESPFNKIGNIQDMSGLNLIPPSPLVNDEASTKLNNNEDVHKEINAILARQERQITELMEDFKINKKRIQQLLASLNISEEQVTDKENLNNTNWTLQHCSTSVKKRKSLLSNVLHKNTFERTFAEYNTLRKEFPLLRSPTREKPFEFVPPTPRTRLSRKIQDQLMLLNDTPAK